MNYECKHFGIYELVDEDTYNSYHEDVLWGMFSDDLLRGLDYIKSKFPDGAMIINNWKWGGSFTDSGLRSKKSNYYSEGSMHSVGEAVDLRFTKYDVEDVYNFLKDDPEVCKYFSRMESIEDAPTWIHLDQKNFFKGNDSLYIFRA